MAGEWLRENVFELLILGTCLAMPVLAALLWFCWGRSAKRPDVAMEQIWAGVSILSLILILVSLMMNTLNLLMWNFWRNFSPG